MQTNFLFPLDIEIDIHHTFKILLKYPIHSYNEHYFLLLYKIPNNLCLMIKKKESNESAAI